ncbi:hypothetical protein D0C36_03595 [Mucilaginibacter conchicola]|uniref:Uncharacterized protein n=1 Tax=Mucilaginibacter conchicola TaxID=2303333 RepID=A0A372NWZ7_9SPHI|nr:hypothetical protein [Mucilaginibacter conchicola]RFZ94638.1 hypothetical protein D0C36_03595 [Mucilaginibacter conchicola]
MNIDDLKDAWKQDQPDGAMPDPEQIGSRSKSPIAKIRRGMQAELIAAVFTYIVIFWVLFRDERPLIIFNISCIFLFVLLTLNTYYFIRFYVFYKSMSRYDLSLKESIAKVVFDLQLNIELYRAYNLCATPLAVIVALLIFCGKWITPFLLKALDSASNPRLFIWLVLTTICSLLVAYLITEWHIRSKYGRALKELRSIWEELNSQTTG